MTDSEDTWDRLEALGRETGHVLCRCPVCTSRVMVSILNASGTSHGTKSAPWPTCKQCRAGSPLGRRTKGVRVEPLGDVSLVRRLKPGHNPTQRQLAKRPAGDGFEWRQRQQPEAKGRTSE